jgi:RHS repeat-associated protein
VTLTAAAEAGSVFSGWGGACESAAPSCTVTLSQAALVVATFQLPPPTIQQYYHLDLIGSVRAVTDAQGTEIRRQDYAAFGEDLVITEAQPLPASAKQPQFAGKARDSETYFDYFGARYYRNTWGRFTTVDPFMDTQSALVNPQQWNRYAYVSNNPLRKIDPNGLYEVDVHKHLTRALAMAAGIDARTASAIAAANQGVDDNWKTGPFWLPSARREFHFTTDETRDELWGRFGATRSAESLGQYFHALQDSYSHAGFRPEPGHIHTHWYDKTFNRPELAVRMALATYNKLVEAAKLLNGTSLPRASWDQIKSYVEAFNRATSLGNKERILADLTGYVLSFREE